MISRLYDHLDRKAGLATRWDWDGCRAAHYLVVGCASCRQCCRIDRAAGRDGKRRGVATTFVWTVVRYGEGYDVGAFGKFAGADHRDSKVGFRRVPLTVGDRYKRICGDRGVKVCLGCVRRRNTRVGFHRVETVGGDNGVYLFLANAVVHGVQEVDRSIAVAVLRPCR